MIKSKIILAVLVLCSTTGIGQTIVKSSIGVFGGSTSQNGITVQQISGQGSNVGTNIQGDNALLQGFENYLNFYPLNNSILNVNDKEDYDLYPNPMPFKTSFTLSANQLHENTLLVLVDMYGKKVWEKTIKVPTNKFNSETINLIQGSYLLKIIKNQITLAVKPLIIY